MKVEVEVSGQNQGVFGRSNWYVGGRGEEGGGVTPA